MARSLTPKTKYRVWWCCLLCLILLYIISCQNHWGSISHGGAVHGLAWLQSSTCINLLATFYHFFCFFSGRQINSVKNRWRGNLKMSGCAHSSKQQLLTWMDYWYLITVNLMLAAPHGSLLPGSPRRVSPTAMEIYNTAGMFLSPCLRYI